MALIKQEEVYPASVIPWAQAMDGVAAAVIAQYDIVVATGVSGVVPKVSPADADATGPGSLFVASGRALAAGGAMLLVPWAIVSDVDTSAAASVGDPVYLSTTAGGWTATRPTGPDDANIVVGHVMSISATVGVVRLEPNASAVKTLTRTATVTVANGATTATLALGAGWANAKVLATINEATTVATVAVASAVVSGAGGLTITLTADPGASNADVFCMVFSSLY